MANNTKHSLTKEDLRYFTGTEHWYRHKLNPKITYTDGARHVAQAGGAYWLLDELALAQAYQKEVAAEPFQKWTLKVREDHTATLTCEDGDYREVFTKELTFTDFPLDEISFFVIDNVILLTSEY